MYGATPSLKRRAENREEPVPMYETLPVQDHSNINTYPKRKVRSLLQSCENQQETPSTSSSLLYQLPNQSFITSDNLLSPVTQLPLSPTSQTSTGGSTNRELPRPKACAPCKNSHVVCGHIRPCARCARQGRPHECVDPLPQKRGRPRNDPDRVGAPRDPNKPRHEPKKRRKADNTQDTTGLNIQQPIVPRRRPSKRAKKLQEDVKPAVTTPTSTAMPSPSVAHIEAYQPATLAITPFSTFSPIPANVLPHTPASTDSNVQSIVHSIVRAVNWTEVNDMLFPGPEMSQTSQPELPETCEFVLTLTETASPTSKSSETAPSCQPSPDVMSGLERLDTMLDGLLKEFDEAGQSGITLPAHNFGDVTGFSSENVELDVLDITAGNLDEMFDANGDIIVMDSRTIPMVNMDTAMTETHGFGNVLLSPLGCGGGTLETTLIENVPPGISGEGETIFTGNMDTSMTEAHIMEQPCSQANEDYLFAHILAIAVAENETTEKKFPTGVAEVEGSSTAIAVLKNEFKGGAGPPVVVSNL